MPSLKSAVSSLWFIRVDGDESVLRPKVRSFAERIDVISLISVHHLGSKKENPHMHACIGMSNSIEKQSFAIQIKKHFEIVDRGYALDVWDGLRNKGATTYLFHEMGNVLVSKQWSESEIKEAQHIGYQIAQAVAETKEKASQKLVERALKHFGDIKPNRFEILLFMMKEIQSGTAYHPGNFKLKSYVEEVEIRLTSGEDISRLAHEYFNSMWRV